MSVVKKGVRDTNQRIWAEGVTAPRATLIFWGNAVLSPPRAVNQLRLERGGR